jgi:1-acyl-sn-glycerol-3-phosphate acyltransferase|tara:strand:+ start:441 stop:1220 length:780 start_codon:yes stop_codon:yes gene_type:complete
MWTKLNHHWRVLATGICFACFGVGGLLLTVTFFPLIYILPASQRWKKGQAQLVIHLSFRLFVAMMVAMGVLAVTVNGREKLRGKGNHLIIANHPTLIDVVVLIAMLSRTECIVKKELWDNPFLKGVVRAAGYISNENPRILIDECVETINYGHSLLIFPEGTRTIPGQAIRFTRGAANIAIRANKEITPVTISCSPPSLTKAQKWYQVPPDRPVELMINVGEAVKIRPFLHNTGNISVSARKLTQYLERYFQQALLTYE